MTPDEIIAAFHALPDTRQMRVAAGVLQVATRRRWPSTVQSETVLWSAAELDQSADEWEAEDKAAAEREGLVEDLARETFYGACGERALPGSWDRQPQVMQDVYRRAATHLLDSPRFEVRRGGDQ